METIILERMENLEKKIDCILDMIRGGISRDKLSPPGTFGDKLSPALKWSEAWATAEMDLRAARSLNGFDKRYVLRPLGPTKVLERVIDTLMSLPQNHNFHVKSKRTYVHVGHNAWKSMSPKLFYREIRKKLIKYYSELVLQAQPKLIKSHGTKSLKTSIIPWTNLYLEKILEKCGKSSWNRRKK